MDSRNLGRIPSGFNVGRGRIFAGAGSFVLGGGSVSLTIFFERNPEVRNLEASTPGRAWLMAGCMASRITVVAAAR